MFSRDRAMGALVGLAVGDALGAPVEFCQRGRFTPVTTMAAGGKFKMRLGEWTDDTAMALCLADSLIECRSFDARDQMERYWRWGNEGYNSTRERAFGVGKTVAKAMSRYLRTGDPFAGSDDPLSAGNGSIMRLAPVVLYYLSRPDEAIRFAAESSRTTHQAEEAIQACQLMAHVMCKAIHGAEEKAELFQNASHLGCSGVIAGIANRSYLDKQEDQIQGSGYVVESLEAALWCFEKTDSFHDAVLKAVNLGDDADTTGAVCGQIAGAYYGFDSIPPEWVGDLMEGQRIIEAAESLINQGMEVIQPSDHKGSI